MMNGTSNSALDDIGVKKSQARWCQKMAKKQMVKNRLEIDSVGGKDRRN